ncbi:MAG: adenylyl-sulfate kinase, partial [Sulfurimonas sp.]|nr:adenylyl-sulfate kinase [Sulfurimonas sp.]
MVIWITGLSGSGKTTIGKLVYEYVKQKNNNTVFLDGDVIRKALDNNYGYTLEDRLKGAKQVSGLCKMLDKEGINVVCSTMSLFKEIQDSNRKEIDKYIEVFLDVDIKILKERDSKKLYSSVKENVVGIDLSYYAPVNPELCLDNSGFDNLDNNVDKIINYFNELENKEQDKTNSKDYWEQYYKSHKKPSGNSPFAEFVSTYLSDTGSFIELGCGNGRDSFYFNETLNLDITAVDQCTEEMNFLNESHGSDKLVFDDGDFTRLVTSSNRYDYIYSRFTLHAVDEEAENRTLSWINNSLNPNGMFFLEARSKKDELFGEGNRVGNDEYFTDHYRRFLDYNVIKS